MRRRYTTARFADRIAAVRALMPDAFIGIDVMIEVMESLYQETADSKYRPAHLYKVLYRAGHLGQKTGKASTITASKPSSRPNNRRPKRGGGFSCCDMAIR